MFDNIKGFQDTEFEIKETRFSIRKLSPMAGFSLSEFIRVNLARSSDSFDVGDGSEEKNAVLFFKSILALDPDVVDYIRKKLFTGVQFENKAQDQKGFADIQGLEDMAFDSFEVINIYEVLVRALCVNFIGSFSELLSKFPGALKFLKESSSKT